MEEILTRFWDNLIGRTEGPLTLRLFLQPVVAIFLATRAGLRDARAHRPPYFWALFYDSGQRREMLRDGWRDIAKVFVIAMILDTVYQVIVSRWVYPGEMLVVAIVLAVLPYLISRGLVTRIARLTQRDAHADEPRATPHR